MTTRRGGDQASSQTTGFGRDSFRRSITPLGASSTPAIPWWRVDFGEEAARAAYAAVMGRRMTMGPLTLDFEDRVAALLDVPHVVATASGTAALSLTLLEAGIGPGDEVIVPARSWIATAHAPYLAGARPVFVDIEPGRPVMDMAAMEKALSPRTRAIIPVHLNGYACDLPRLRLLTAGRDIAIIEDACQAFLSASPEGGWLGTHSRTGCFSLSIGKMISSGQGGFVVTQDPKIARRLSIMRTQGASNITLARWEMPGGNFRFWDLPAAVALSQLDLIEEKTAGVRRVYKFYREALKSHPALSVAERDPDSGELPLYVDCFCPERPRVLAHLSAHGIQARPYYENLSSAPHFLGTRGHFPNADRYARDGLILPCGPDRTAEELELVVDVLNRFSLERR